MVNTNMNTSFVFPIEHPCVASTSSANLWAAFTKFKPLFVFACFWLPPFFTACATDKNLQRSKEPTYQFTNPQQQPDYSNLDYWAAHSAKHDPSDSVPAPLANDLRDTTVDVFFIHPTTFTNDTVVNKTNANINDAYLNAKTDYTTILYQASVFNHVGRIFAPRYRQAHLGNYYIDAATAQPRFDTAYADVQKAFAYYLAHENKGRPIIIASHSQGTTHAGRLLKDFFENKPLQKQLVCAYIIGMPVPSTYFATLAPCLDSNATGCFVAWRSFREGNEGPFAPNEKFKSIVINPITWTTETSLVSKDLHKGAMLWKFNKLYKQNVDAQIHNNVLWVSKPKFFGNLFFTATNYHIADYNLFYLDIRANVQNRVRQFWLRNRK